MTTKMPLTRHGHSRGRASQRTLLSSRPETRMRRVALTLGVLSSIAIGCAARSRPIVGYAEMENRSCGHLPSGETEVRTIVRDEEGRPLQGIHLYLLPADDRHGIQPLLATSGSDGSATVRASDGFYAAAAVFVGFEPQSRLVQIADGCSGTLTFTLRVLQVEGLSTAGGRDNKQLQRTRPTQAIGARR